MINAFKIIILFNIITINVFSQSVINNNYKFFNLENMEVNINIKMDYVNENIVISLNSYDTICINGFRELIKDVNVIDNNFIQINFLTRGGSGVKNLRLVLICVSKSKLYKAFDVLSTIQCEFHNTFNEDTYIYDESSIYNLSFLTLQSKDDKHMLIAQEYDMIKSQNNPKLNYERYDTLYFKFDTVRKIFSNSVSMLQGIFIIDSDQLGLAKNMIEYNGYFPVIKLSSSEYYYIENNWYIKDGERHLCLFSTVCK